MRLSNRLGLPEAIVRALSVDEYDRGNSDISVTGLTSPPRLVALREAHADELTEDVSDLIFALLGKAVHKILELAADATSVVEKRFFMSVPGPLGPMVVSGQTDSIDLRPSVIDGKVGIDDWKTAKVAEMQFGVKAEREQQLNLYKALAELNGYSIGRLRDIFILRDWSKVQASRAPATVATLTGTQPESDYPDSQVVVHDVRIWGQQELADYVMNRVALHQQAQHEYTERLNSDSEFPQDALPLCSDEERWARPTSIALMKPGAKRASKVVDTEEEAGKYMEEHPKDSYVMEVRPGESIRCAYYCPVSSICDQWRAIREERASA